MKVFESIKTIETELIDFKSRGKSIGLVPTMGGLHKGHLALIEKCKDHNNVTVCSIFVNPVQFNNPNDLKNYPRAIEKDLEKLDAANCDIVFVPSEDEMYPFPPRISFDFGNIDKEMEGRFRPGHFNGVGIIVSKLFNIIMPHKAYFGEKDLQQLIIIRQLVRDLNFGIEIVGVPTVREDSGLAMASRNERLSPEQRQRACIIYKALKTGKEGIISGMALTKCMEKIQKVYETEPAVKPEYIEFVDMDSLVLLKGGKENTKHMAICTAAYIGNVRLIDNINFII